MTTFKLGFYAGASPFRGSRLAFWRHHDAVFRKLCRNDNVEINVILPVQGGQTFVDRLYKGDTSILYPTLQEMNIKFLHPEELYQKDLDALYLDDIHTLTDIVVDRRTYDTAWQRNRMREVTNDMIIRNKPILISDTDGFTTEYLENTRAHLMDIYETLSWYPNLYVTSPFENEKLRSALGGRFHVIPFEVDPEDFKFIEPLSKRNFVLRYVGNEYYRKHFVPIFDKLSQVGKVKVNGAGWNAYKPLAPRVEWTVKVLMTPENAHAIYSSSAFGLTGRSTYNQEKDQVIFLYRWKEYLNAGTYIIPEDVPAYTDLLPEGNLTFRSIELAENRDIEKFLSISNSEYANLVEEQRISSLRYLHVDKWVPVFKDILKIN